MTGALPGGAVGSEEVWKQIRIYFFRKFDDPATNDFTHMVSVDMHA